MRVRSMVAAALALVALVPAALALDALPQESTWGPHDARVLVRLPQGGRLRVEAEPPIAVALAEQPGGPARSEAVAAPAEFDVIPLAPEDSWHGLAGTVELVLHRDDAKQAVEILAEDEQGGAVFEWPPEAAHGVDAPGILAALGMAASVAIVWRHARAP